MKNIRIYMLLIVVMMMGVMMVGCGSNSAANVSGVSIKQEEVEYDFRNSNWGDSIDDVKKNEDLKLSAEIKDDNLLVYSDGKIVNLDVTVIYGFNKNDELDNGFYNVNVTHTNNNLYIDDYEDIKESLSIKYGEPSYDDMEWNDDLYKGNPDDYGFAVSLGDLQYSSGWKVNNTYITLTLKGDNNDIDLSLIYQDGTSGREIDLSGL